MGDPFVRPGIACRPEIERVVLKHNGTGTADTTAEEWLADQHRDSLAATLQRQDLLLYTATALDMTPARLRYMLLLKMVDPLAFPPISNESMPAAFQPVAPAASVRAQRTGTGGSSSGTDTMLPPSAMGPPAPVRTQPNGVKRSRD